MRGLRRTCISTQARTCPGPSGAASTRAISPAGVDAIRDDVIVAHVRSELQAPTAPPAGDTRRSGRWW
jgi:hypothetical protein